MKAIAIARCARCGYRYTPGKNRKVLTFHNEIDYYSACEQCMVELGRMIEAGATDEEKKAFIESFRI